MFTILTSTLVFIVVFSLLILIHEWGHFYAARFFGVKVEEFGMGLPPRFLQLYKDAKGTIYSLNVIPFGGFVRMYGEDNSKEIQQSPAGSFASKPVYQRVIIVLGGVIMNFLLGFVLITSVLMISGKYIIVDTQEIYDLADKGLLEIESQMVEIQGVVEDSIAQKKGIKSGDVVVRFNNETPTTAEDFTKLIKKSDLSLTQELVLLRGEEEISVDFTLDEKKQLGVGLKDSIELKHIPLSFTKAVRRAAYDTFRLSYLTMSKFVEVLVGFFARFTISREVAGPIGIAQVTHSVTQYGTWSDLLSLIAVLSISLGAINVLPIPALDGGRFMPLIYEGITRKKPNPEIETRIHGLGFIALIVFILAVSIKDIYVLASAYFL